MRDTKREPPILRQAGGAHHTSCPPEPETIIFVVPGTYRILAEHRKCLKVEILLEPRKGRTYSPVHYVLKEETASTMSETKTINPEF